MSQQSPQLQPSLRRQKRPHVYELDPLRTCTALSVIAVHVLASTAYLNATPLGADIQNAFVVSFHFTREIFMFVTAFALVYVYHDRPLSLRQFWMKRSLGVVLPYAFWSLVYVVVNTHPTSLVTFLKTSLFDLLTGNASYQLYYILLTIQFYMIFPLFLAFLRRYSRHPWRLLIVSFVIQLVLFYVDYHTIQRSSLPLWSYVSAYQNRFVLIYEFYFVLGGLAALYFEQIRAFVSRYALLIVAAFLVALAGLWAHFALQIAVYHESMGYATSVLQPIMVFYSVAVIGLALWLSHRWAAGLARVAHKARHWSVRFWGICSDASFGVYLIHILILNALLQHLVPLLPAVWPLAMRVVLLWLLVAGSSLAISIALMYTPFLSRLVGRDGPRRREPAPSVEGLVSASTSAARQAPSAAPPPDGRVPNHLRTGATAHDEASRQNRSDSAPAARSGGRRVL